MDLKDKNILVTGASGFVGRELCKGLGNEGARVFSFDKETGQDVTDKKQFDHLPSIDLVYHLASILDMRLTNEDPNSTYNVNVLGTLNVLEFCRKYSGTKSVHVSSKGTKLIHVSSYVYGKPRVLPVREDHVINPNNNYAMSKRLAEMVCEYHNRVYETPIIIARPFNIFGPSQRGDFLIPTIVNQVKQGKDVEVMDLRPKRDFLFIDDFVESLIGLGKHDVSWGIFNIGSGRSYSVEEIAKTIIKASGKKLNLKSREIERQNEVPDCYADLSRITSAIGWRPKVSLEEGVKRILDSSYVHAKE